MANVQRGARAGAAAVALGLSLAWPTIAIASADSPGGDSSSVSAGPAKTTGTAHSARTAKPTQGSTSSKRSSPARKATSAARVQASTPDATTTDKPKAQSSKTVSDGKSSATVETATSSSAQTTDSQQTAAVTTPSTPKVAEASATPTAATTNSTITALRVPSANASPADVITGFFSSIQGLFGGAALLVRRTFFNEAPTVAPIQLTGETLVDPINGQINATDPDADTLVYKVAQQPHYGTLALNTATGAYTYTPNSNFKGVDSFVVSATDTGLHINLLNWFREPSTYAAGAVYEAGAPKITYTFTYGNGSQYWSSAARAELAATAVYLSSYFAPAQDVNITYAVTGQRSLTGSTLASAGSDLISESGFSTTVVQEKILHPGVEDPNGVAADGTIDWNFGYGWGYFDTVPPGSYDFQSTAMHELLHTYGFLSVIDSAGNNSIENWTDFDKNIVDKNGNSVFIPPPNGTTFDTTYNSNLTGGNGGLYFGLPGSNAWIKNGNKPVPLYTPSPWESGSSMSHLNDNYYNGSDPLTRPEMLMNAASDTGLGVRVLSPIEIAIMKDLGYTMVSASPTVAVLFIGLMLVRRRKTAKSA
ncbi:Ig-like domain-containing protein [Mycolicibacterium pallens]|uniref:Cadherin-like domain-containing protein n=1 Tax=Mycolicibacterium pallens TaxID=370524 RepID=A0ABX8VEV3_9MYCO|nr:Ig-like domain-containing protein [Mycolicibacterium pallens]QYL16344.1 cadherin-like domain-containing protein [Mycolicibacterium pallens]